MEGSFICICCRRRCCAEDAVLRERYLGICSECNQKIKYVGRGNVLPGSESVDSVLSPLYYDEPIKSAIKRYKFYAQVRYAKIFVEILYEYLKDWDLARDFDFMTPVPISRKRLLERGYNQTDILAEQLADRLGIDFRNDCIFKKKHNRKQSKVKHKTMRFENVRDVYLADAERVRDKRILLLDDIFTSGATMEACAKELKMRGAEAVVGITFAAVIK